MAGSVHALGPMLCLPATRLQPKGLGKLFGVLAAGDETFYLNQRHAATPEHQACRAKNAERLAMRDALEVVSNPSAAADRCSA